jgi:integrase
LQRLGQVLTEVQAEGSETPFIVAAFRLLILTGCRLGEIQTLKWEYITPRHMELPDTKTGARRIPLPQAARDVLDALPHYAGNPYVIAGKLEGRFATDFQHPWRRIRDRAGLPDVRIHDLRHTYASMAVSSGMPIQMVGRLLGHSQLQTTMRYAHLADDPVLEAAQQNADQLSALINSPGAAGATHLRLVR